MDRASRPPIIRPHPSTQNVHKQQTFSQEPQKNNSNKIFFEQLGFINTNIFFYFCKHFLLSSKK